MRANNLRGEISDSYDPRVWAREWERRRSAGGNAAASRGRDRPPLRAALALGLVLAILAAGGLTAWLQRPEPGAPAAAEGPQATAAAPAGPGELRRTLILPSATDLPRMLAAQGIAPDLARQITDLALPSLRLTGEVRAVLVLDATTATPKFIRLEASNGDSSGVVVRMAENGELAVSQVAAQVESKILVQHGTMDRDSFYSSAVAVGIPNSLIPVFAKALSFDFDFQREVTAGDAFEAAWSQPVNSAGEEAGAPILLYASLTTSAKSASVYRSVGADGTEEWYDASGRSTVRSFMRTPVDGARVTSRFGMRFHPVLHYNRLHAGVDFAVPVGTPVYASAAGVVTGASPTGCGGNMAVVRHDNGWVTRYFHLSRYAEGLTEGQRIPQGLTLGLSGTSGTCTTGPHLHYEVRINDEPVDPLSIQTEGSGKTLAGPGLVAFEAMRDRIDVARAQQSD